MRFTETKRGKGAKYFVDLFDDLDWIATFAPPSDEPGIELNALLWIVENTTI